MKRNIDKNILEHRDKSDRRILILFSISLVLILSILTASLIYLGTVDLEIIIGAVFLGLMTAFSISGILAFIYNSKKGIISTKKVMIWFLLISILSAVVFTYFLIVDILAKTNNPNLYVGSSTFYGTLVGVYFGMILAVFLGLLFLLFMGFGICGIMSGVERKITPRLLVGITNITSNTTESMKEHDKKTYRGYMRLRWAFNIPDTLDTKELTFGSAKPRNKLQWRNFVKAMKWQILFGLVIVIYVSFSPFLLDIVEMTTLFSIASSVTALMPLLILPWFIYLRLDLKIKGPTKDFKLFNGLKSRLLQTFVAFGTILLLIRLGLRSPAFQSVMWSFSIYIVFFMISVFIFTFVYFNYFENYLAHDIAEKYKERLGEDGKLKMNRNS